MKKINFKLNAKNNLIISYIVVGITIIVISFVLVTFLNDYVYKILITPEEIETTKSTGDVVDINLKKFELITNLIEEKIDPKKPKLSPRNIF